VTTLKDALSTATESNTDVDAVDVQVEENVGGDF
jgi:hypothetical protein